MRRVTKAVDAGFDRIQRMYLVEETFERDIDLLFFNQPFILIRPRDVISKIQTAFNK